MVIVEFLLNKNKEFELHLVLLGCWWLVMIRVYVWMVIGY